MSRAHFSRVIQDDLGNLLKNSVVRILQQGTTTPVSTPIYTEYSGVDTHQNPWVVSDGVIDFYMENAGVFRIGVTNSAYPSEKFFEDVTVGSQTILSGSGRPEGIVEAGAGTRYRDTLVSNGALEWLKYSDDENTGWKVNVGDTGWRDIADLIESPGVVVSGEQCLLRRDRNRVEVRVSMAWASAWTSGDPALTLPDGFRQAVREFMPVGYTDSYPVSCETDGSLLLYSSASSGLLRWTFSWITDDAWPTGSLPGTAI